MTCENDQARKNRELSGATEASAMGAAFRPATERRTLASSLGAARALVRLVCSFVSVKLTAVYLGPSGLALVAQFNNFMTLCQGVVITALETAAARLTAEYGDDAERRRRLLGTIGKVGIGLGLPTALAVTVASPWLATWLLNDIEYAWVFVLGALSILAAILNAVLLSALSARGDIVRVVMSNILATVLGVAMFAPASIWWGVTGALYASSGIYLGSLGVTLLLIYRSTLISVRDFVGPFDRAEGRRIAGFYPMLLVHAVTVPLSLILIRGNVASALSLESAGLWQACWKLSDTYLMVVTSTVTTQFMVRLGESVKFPSRLRDEVLKTLGLAVGGTVAIAVGIYLLRFSVVTILFSPAFLPVADFMGVQLVGDVFKITGFTFGYVLVATLRSRWYIAIEIIVPAVFLGMTGILVPEMGVPGVTTAYLISGVLHCTLSLIALRDVIFLRGRSRER